MSAMRAAKVKTSFEMSTSNENYEKSPQLSHPLSAAAKNKICWAALALATVAAFVMTSGVEGPLRRSNVKVSPVKGLTRLSPDEFRDVRLARPGESILVTGGLGFIGSHVVELLLHRGFDVTVLDDESNGHNHNVYAAELVPRDITVAGDLPPLPGASAGSDDGDSANSFTHVVHLAAAISVAESMTDGDKYERINFDGSKKVLDWIESYNLRAAAASVGSNTDATAAAVGIRRVVAASSAAVYGDPKPSLLPLNEDAPYGGMSPYADTKYRMETLMRGFVTKQNVFDQERRKADEVLPTTSSAVALRFFNVYGPRQDPKNPYSGVMSLFLEMASTGKDINVLGDGEMTRDFIYVKDVARAIVMALLQEDTDGSDEGEKSGVGEPASFAVYNVCTGRSITINDLALLVKGEMGSSSDIKHLEPRVGDIRDSRCNPNGADEGMDFVSAVSQETGLKKTAEWFREEIKK